MKRLALHAGALLLVGALLNVGLAWFLAVQPSRPVGTQGGVLGKTDLPPGRPTHWFESREIVHRGVTRVLTQRREISTPIARGPDVATVVPRWVDTTPPESLRRWTLHLGAGWPQRSMRCRFIQAGPATIEPSGCIELPTLNVVPWHQRGLPLIPIWRGFAINALLFGAILAAPLYTSIGVRRYVRIRRGRCPRCGYPVGTAPRCSECGGAVRAR